MSVDGGQCVAQFWWCGWGIGGQWRSAQPVVDFGGAGRTAARRVSGRRVGPGSSFDEPVEAEPGEVVAHLVDRVVDAKQAAHLGTQAPVGEPEGVETDTEGAEQGHDPRISEP